MAFNPTPKQKLAIETNGNLLVAAAAGSGKTAVLVERVIKKLTDKVEPVSADRLLIVTFTNSAAAEMRSRIEVRLDEEYRKNPNDIGLLRQKHLISGAKICTIDSFCIDLVRENFDKVGVSPDFKISDTNSLRPINENVLLGIINEYFENNDSLFKELLDIVGSEYDERNFINVVFDLFNYSRQMPFPDAWLDSLKKHYNNGIFNSSSEWYIYVFNRANSLIADMRNSLACAVNLVASVDKAADRYMPTFILAGELLSEISDICNSGNWDEFYIKISEFYLPSLPNSRGFKDVEEIEAVKTIWKFINDDILNIQRLFCGNIEAISNSFLKLDKPVKLLVDIVKEYSNRLFDEYSNQNTFTFFNTEQMALSLLCELKDNNICVKDGAEEFLNRFDEVMVDEYQDTNNLQDMLFYVLSNRESRLFVVGDVKQSIYGFRGANPNNFLKKKNSYIPVEKADESSAKKIILGNNFRSSAGVCQYINFFFENLMNEQTGNIIYNDEERLVASAEYPPCERAAVEVQIIDCGDDEEKSLILEARHIAGYIKNVMVSEPCIKLDKTTLRKAEFSDFAILLRTTKDKASTLANELKKQGIPVDFSIEGYADTVEVATFLSLLKVVDNPRNDIELLNVMLSPIFGFTAEDLALMKINSKRTDIFTAVVFAAANNNIRAAEFLSKIEEYRSISLMLSIPKLISNLLTATGYINIVSAMKDGTRRKVNLMLLIDYAVQYHSTNNGGLNSFVNYILKQSQNGMKSASVSSGSDTVKIMSIHASKGLQFPVCIIANTSAKFNDSDSRSDVLFGENLGIGFSYYDETLKQKVSTVGREVILDNIRKSGREEELRLFYVAMTRAEDRLVLITALTGFEKKLNTAKAMLISSDSEINSFVFSKTKSFGDWIILSSLLHPDAAMLRTCGGTIIPYATDSRVLFSVINSVQIENCDVVNNDSEIVINEDLLRCIKENISYIYPYDLVRSIEAKASVSSLANKAESERFSLSAKPSFMSDDGITAAERGTAMHKILQFIDFSKYKDFESEIDRLYEWQYITEREAESVNRRALSEFFESGIFKRILNSNNVKREMRFLTEMPLYEIEDTENSIIRNEKIIVQGAVDLCFEEPDGIVVLDFKTDRVSEKNELIDAYAEQLNIYASACEKIFGKKVKQKIIYSFALSEEIIIASDN